MSNATIDALEARRLFAASLIDGVLTVGGTSGDDVIEVFRAKSNTSKLNVAVNGVLQQFWLKDVAYLNIRGFDGRDTIKISKVFGDIYAPMKIFGERGADTITSDASASLTIRAGADNDFVDLRTSAAFAVIYGEGGNDTVYGAGGMTGPVDHNDHVVHPGRNLMFGGDGSDSLMCVNGQSTMYGEGGNDSLYANNGDNLLDGGADHDLISGGMHEDICYGGAGQDLIMAGAGHDIVYGGIDSDTVHGNAGDDTVLGGDGDDALYGEDGSDDLHGERGRDTLTGHGGADYLYGGDDNDTLLGDTPDFYFAGETDVLFGGGGDDLLEGMGGNDLLHGNDGIDTLRGGDGDDDLDGGAGADLLYGNAGNDDWFGVDAGSYLADNRREDSGWNTFDPASIG